MIDFLEKNREITIILTILIAIEIFYFSSLPGSVSAGGLPFLATIYHFIVFFLFSFFLLLTIKNKKELKTKYLIYAVIISLAYAILDEIHQSFVPGRDATIRDIITNTAGIIFAMLVAFYHNRKNIKKSKKSKPKNDAKKDFKKNNEVKDIYTKVMDKQKG